MQSTTQNVPLEQLVVTESNARKDHVSDPHLQASIASAGLMYPITVKALDDGTFEVIDGARRLYAIRDLRADGRWPENFVPCSLVQNGLDSLEYSLHGNLHLSMHPLDEADAIATLSKRDEDKMTIAARFGRTVTWVDQRAKLSLLIPEVKKLFREREIDLEGAMAFTLADPKVQKQIVKAQSYNSPAQIRRMATQTKVNAAHAIFPLAEWPDDKIERDLFSDEVWLTSIPLFLKMQDKWFARLADEYKEKGYHQVVTLKPTDWETPNRYSKVENATEKQRGKLSVLLQMAENGMVRRWEDMIPNKEAKKKTPAKNGGPDTTTISEVREKKAKDLTVLQAEEICMAGAAQLFELVAEGKANESVIQFLVISAVANHSLEPWAMGSTLGRESFNRWERLKVLHKVPSAVTSTSLFAGVSYDNFVAKYTAAARRQLFLEAVARMIAVPHNDAHAFAKSLPVKNWVKPSEAFFGRWNSDQLLEYLKRSGATLKDMDKLKKAELVKLAFEYSSRPKAWKIGLGN